MIARVLAFCLPLLLLVGCIESQRSRLVSGGPPPAGLARAERYVSPAPATEESARRVLSVGQKLVAANPQLGFRPIFVTVGVPHVEIFHRGGGVEGYQIFVSEGLVKRCTSDDQLAAVLSMQLGRVVSERQAMAGPKMGQLDRPPPSVTIGNDTGGAFGPPDGTRMMELARYDRERRPAGPPPSPEVLAKSYLVKAGIATKALADAAPILREAEDHCTVEKQLVKPLAIPPLTPALTATAPKKKPQGDGPVIATTPVVSAPQSSSKP